MKKPAAAANARHAVQEGRLIHGEEMYDDPRNTAEVSHPCAQSLQTLRAPAWLPASIRLVPHLLPRVGFRGQDPRRGQVFLVEAEGLRMSVNDPIADLLTRIRNAVMVGHQLVAMPSSKLKVSITKILKEEGYITSYEVGWQDHRKCCASD
jgi:hypothetical protein